MRRARQEQAQSSGQEQQRQQQWLVNTKGAAENAGAQGVHPPRATLLLCLRRLGMASKQ
jgi:hypothetical protein